MTPPLRIGIAGLGTVGAGVLMMLDTHRDAIAARAGREIRVTAVSARDRSKDRGVPLDAMNWHDSAIGLADDGEVDVVVELIGGEDGIAKELVERSLASGKHVVTANKALIAHHGQQLAVAAEESGAVLAFEAAVAGGEGMSHPAAAKPSIKTSRRSL